MQPVALCDGPADRGQARMGLYLANTTHSEGSSQSGKVSPGTQATLSSPAPPCLLVQGLTVGSGWRIDGAGRSAADTKVAALSLGTQPNAEANGET